jgi:uncharacterized protein (TIGR03435 family)
MEIRNMMRAILGAGLIVCTSFGVFGQSAPPAFEVASVKPAPPMTGNKLQVSLGGDPGRVNYSNVTLKIVMTRAYGVKTHQISGPAWLDSERYDLVAKVPAGASKDDIPLMLQNLLADRFKLTLHREKKVMPVYALVAAKSGPKLHPAEGEGGLRMSMGPKGRQLTGKTSIPKLADALSGWMDRPVLDMTEIQGIYDIDLEWIPDSSQPNPKFALGGGIKPEGAGEGKAAAESADGVSIFTALQEKLGLKLETRKSPVEILVVDNAERVPTEN